MSRAHRLVRHICLGLAFLAAAGCGGDSSSSTGSSTHLSPGDAPKTVTAFGDSITVGILELRRRDLGLSTANNYPAILQRKLQGLDRAWTVINRGLGGETTVDGAARLPGTLAADTPGFVLIMEGTNDARRCSSADDAVNNLKSMVRSAKASGSIPIIGTVPPSFTSRDCTHETIAIINDQIRAFASSEGVTLAEIFNGMNRRGLFGNDHIHPNEAGYAVMAEIWFQAMLQVIPRTATAALHPRR